MDLLDRLLAHDAWTTRQLLVQCKTLTDAQLDQRFDIDNRTLRECFEHIIDNMEAWTDELYERPVRNFPSTNATPMTMDDLLARLSTISREFATLARRINREKRWDDVFIDPLENPANPRTFGGAIAHLITHSMHHRAQAMVMMERLGLHDHIEGDVLSWEAIAHGWN